MKRPARHTAAVLIATLSFAAFLPVVLEKPVRLATAAPADRAVLSTPPSTVTLTFTHDLDRRDTHATTVDANGRVMDQRIPVVEGRNLTLPVTIDASGGYRVVYHVRLLDGAELSGETAFAVGDAGLLPPADAPTELSAHHDITKIDPVTAVVLGANVVVIAGIGVQLIRRRRVQPVIPAD
ncbi:copper resistance protein CopC [Micromonospora sp. CPCC 206060]|uniref:copper resistance CopC family protein n=1 Tax=Micromonospora sp. CPCC 206060 TaxID=3122406 RepID=UPI002FF2F828